MIWLLFALALGCSASSEGGGSKQGTGATPGAGSSGSTGATGPSGLDLGGGSGTGATSGGGDDNNPTSCEQAAKSETYIGCDFWPTVTYNPVYHEFAFAVVLANGGDAEASVAAERGRARVATAMVPARGLATVPLPWVEELKGEEFTRTDATTGARKKASVRVDGGAYHLTSTRSEERRVGK